MIQKAQFVKRGLTENYLFTSVRGKTILRVLEDLNQGNTDSLEFSEIVTFIKEIPIVTEKQHMVLYVSESYLDEH